MCLEIIIECKNDRTLIELASKLKPTKAIDPTDPLNNVFNLRVVGSISFGHKYIWPEHFIEYNSQSESNHTSFTKTQLGGTGRILRNLKRRKSASLTSSQRSQGQITLKYIRNMSKKDRGKEKREGIGVKGSILFQRQQSLDRSRHRVLCRVNNCTFHILHSIRLQGSRSLC